MVCNIHSPKIFVRALPEAPNLAEGVSLNKIIAFYVRFIHEILFSFAFIFLRGGWG
jgi:hypothetical protein